MSTSNEKISPIEEITTATKKTNRKWCWIMAGVIGLIIIVIAIVVPIVVLKERNKQLNQAGGNNSNSDSTKGANNNGNNVTLRGTGYSVYRDGDGIINGYAVSKFANLTRIQTISADALTNKQRIFVVGDIHGCLDEFNQLIDRIQFNPNTDQLILAGDMIAKGPSNTGVIRRAKELNALCVRGNHDDKAVRFKTYERLNGPIGTEEPDAILPEGDVPDPLKYKNKHLAISRELSDDDYDYLTSCPSILHLPALNNSIIVHAGLDPTVTNLPQQQPLTVMTMRDIMDGHPTDEKKVGTPWTQTWNQAQEQSSSPITVYYGHDASRGLVQQRFSYGLDTGCVYGRALTAIEMKSKQTVSVPCKQYAV